MGLHKGERKSPFAHGGAGGAGTLLLRVMKRRNVSLVQKGSMPDCAIARGMQRESAASPLPRWCCSTTHILRTFLRQYLNDLLRKTVVSEVSDYTYIGLTGELYY